MGNLFTIGHSKHDINYFINLLKNYQVDYVLDVRSVPYSKYAAQYNKEVIAEGLRQANVNYAFMGNFFGARPKNPKLYNSDGQLDFELVLHSKLFNAGLNNVALGLKKGYNIALMCTEKEPIDCHRAILITRAFDLRNIPVEHILADGGLLSQKQLDEQLLDMYFPNRQQLSWLGNGRDLLEEAYRKRNKDIGYRQKIR